MTHRAGDGEHERHIPPGPPPMHQPTGLPMWVTITVVLVLLALLVYSIVWLGPDGLPVTYFVGGLLGVYGGANELLKARDRRAQSETREEATAP